MTIPEYPPDSVIAKAVEPLQANPGKAAFVTRPDDDSVYWKLELDPDTGVVSIERFVKIE